MAGWIAGRLGAILISLVCVAGAASSLQAAEKRVALVVGNAAYTHVTPLDNPTNDARLIAEVLKGAGFEVVGGKALTDLDRQGLEQAIAAFGKTVKGGAVGLFYYSGHGVQVDGKNYLIPVSANVESRTDIKYQLVDADFVLDEMNAAGTSVNVIILDACRNNPFGGRGLRGAATGLAQMNAPRGTLIAYSTAPGKVASDGGGRNSPFTAALARSIAQPGVRIEDVFIQVGQEVEKTTGGEQEPWQANNLRGVFYVAGAPQGATSPSPASVPAPAPTATAAAADKDALFWQSVQNGDDPALYDAYLRQFPNGTFAPIAKARRDAGQRKPSQETRSGGGGEAAFSGDFLRPRSDRRPPPPPPDTWTDDEPRRNADRRRPDEQGGGSWDRGRPNGPPPPLFGGNDAGPPEGAPPPRRQANARGGDDRPNGPPPNGGREGKPWDPRLRDAHDKLRDKDYDAAERGFQAVLDAHPDDPLAGPALLGLGEAHFGRKNFREAAINFARSYREHPGAPMAPNALFKTGLALAQLGKNKEACTAFKRFESEFPDSPERLHRRADEEKKRLGCR